MDPPDLTCIEVAIALPVQGTYTYAVPENMRQMVATGKRVFVPFGKRGVTGYVIGFSEQPVSYDIKKILDILDEHPLFPETMIPFFRWISDYYMFPIGEVIRCALPSGLNIYDHTTLEITEAGRAYDDLENLPPVQKDILTELMKGASPLKNLAKNLNKSIAMSLLQMMQGYGWLTIKKTLKGGTTKSRTERYLKWIRTASPDTKLTPQQKRILETMEATLEMAMRDLNRQIPGASRSVKPLVEAGYIQEINKPVYRDPFGEFIEPDSPLALTPEQTQVVATITRHIGSGFIPYLLSGVTGSGKTEVYLQIAEKVISEGWTVLVLVPEIALISQIERRFRARFGQQVAVLHSRLSPGERLDQWQRILNGEARIAIGARSAIYAPLEHLGIVIVDEEHDPSYKQDSDLLYHARDLAVVRAKLSGCIALLGSATPSMQSLYNTQTGKWNAVHLTQRIDDRPLPEITIVDMRNHRDEKGVRRFISPQLYKAMQETYQRGEQIILFLNRRGFANLPVCANCGSPLRCDHCDVTLTLHQSEHVYKCHFCGFIRPLTASCKECLSEQIIPLGMGTEKLESAIQTMFPNARIARMDRDTTSRKNSLLEILKKIINREIDILIGTQMVAKGHDFPNISLVGIILADLSLNFPDFRAGELTFQLLAQVAGRAGRGDTPGRVILQTYNPTHFCIESAKNQDCQVFYNQEIGFRDQLDYPPFSKLIQVRISGIDKDKTKEYANRIGEIFQSIRQKHESFANLEILGPIESPIQRIASRYRWQMLIKGKTVRLLHGFVRYVISENPGLLHKNDMKAVIDVDPYFLM